MTAINKITREDLATFASAGEGDNLLDLYQHIAGKSAIYPGQGTPLGLAYCGLKVNGEAGELAEHIGKAMRDDNLINVVTLKPEPGGFMNSKNIVKFNELTPERRALIIKEIGDNLWYLARICAEVGITFSDAAYSNLEKLCDRTERDALRGSGDER